MDLFLFANWQMKMLCSEVIFLIKTEQEKVRVAELELHPVTIKVTNSG